jgi:O-antigen ligase
MSGFGAAGAAAATPHETKPEVDHRTEHAPPPDVARRIDAAGVLGAIACAAVFLIPLIFDPRSYDVFRLPKLLLLQATGLLLVGGTTFAIVLGKLPLDSLLAKKRKKSDLLLAALVGWSAVCAVFSAHRPTSFYALVTIVSCAALFLVTRMASRRWSTLALAAVLAPASINAIVAVLQETRVWTAIAPLTPGAPHMSTVGLLGNPNDVGSYLVPAFAVALGWMLATRRLTARIALFAVVAILAAGLTASGTRAALLAASVCVVAATILRWRWRAVFPIAVFVLAATLVALAYPPLLERLEPPTRRGDVARFMSGRLVAFAAAVQMVREAPVFGVGPGCFVYEYVDAAIVVYPRMNEFALAGKQFIFGEAHNDHLQIAAETGMPGYILFACALGWLGSLSRKRNEDDETERRRVARMIAMPLVVSGATLMLLQFPLYLAASLSTYVFIAAAIAGWSDA